MQSIYASVEQKCEEFGLAFTPLEVTTDDNYKLSLFHIYDKENRDPTKGPIMFQHGSGGTGEGWIRNQNVQRLAALGHDIYLGNARGTRYSMGHEDYDYTVKEDEQYYWDFSYQNLADDVLANMRKMSSHSGDKKGWYFGSSQGTASMQVALAEYEEELHNYLHRAILLAPCVYLTLGPDTDEVDTSKESMESIGWMRELGVYATNGPNWEQDVETICANRPDSDCQKAKKQKKRNPKPVKEHDHIKQNYFVKEQQTFVEDWEYPYEFLGKLFPMEDIDKIPVTMFSGSKDNLCPPSRAYEHAQRISTMANFIELEGEGHVFGGRNSEAFFNLMLDELTDEFPDEFRYWKVNLNEEDDGNDSGEEEESDGESEESDEDDEDGAYEIIGQPAQKLEDCAGDCTECRDAWMSDTPDDIYQVCVDTRLMKYLSPCPEDSRRWSTEKCNKDGPCMISHPFDDDKKLRSRDAACRTTPDYFEELDQMVYRKRECKEKWGFCSTCDDGETCHYSYHTSDPLRWKGASGICRCSPL